MTIIQITVFDPEGDKTHGQYINNSLEPTVSRGIWLFN